VIINDGEIHHVRGVARRHWHSSISQPQDEVNGALAKPLTYAQASVSGKKLRDSARYISRTARLPAFNKPPASYKGASIGHQKSASLR